MIQYIRNGGFQALITGWLIVLLTKILWFVRIGRSTDNSTVDFNTLFGVVELTPVMAVLIVTLLLVLQAFLLNRIILREAYFERNNQLVFFGFLLANLLNTHQLTAISPMIFMGALLFVFHRLLALTDEDMGSIRVFLDCGTVYGLALLVYPRGVFFFPFILFVFGQFTVFDFNRFLIVLLSILMVLAAALMLSYVLNGVWISDSMHFLEPLSVSEFALLWSNTGFKGLVVLVVSILLFLPFLTRVVGQSQIRQRRLVRAFWLIPLFSLPVFLLEGGIHDTQFMALPVSLSWALVAYRTRSTLYGNLILLCVVWALLVIQWSVF